MGNLLFLHAYSAVAQALAQNTGVVIRTGANGYSTNGKVINMPTVDEASIGPLIHEVSHIKATDFTVVVESAQQPLLKHITNLLEDIRIEQLMGNEFPGARMYLADMVEHLVSTGFFSAPQEGEENQLITQYMLYRLRADVLGQAGALEYSNAAEHLLEAKMPKGALIKLNALMYRVESAVNTRDCMNAARAIITMMEEEAKKEEEEKEKQEQQQSDPNQGQPENQAGNDGQGDDQQDGQNQPGDDSAGQGEPDDQSGNDSTGGTDGGQEKSFLRKVLDAGDDAKTPDIKDALAKASQQAVNEGRVDKVGLPFVTREFSGGGSATSQMLDEVNAATNALKVKTRGLLQAESTATARNVMQGTRIDPRKLHRAPTGGAIFKKVTPGKKHDTAVAVLVDKSPSMDADGRIGLAKKAALAAALAFAHPGVETAVLAFPHGAGNALLKGFSDRASAQVGKFEAIGTEGSTPMAEAIMGACMELANHRFTRKILLVATDGAPDNLPAALEAIALARRSGIEVLGMGIMLDVSRTFGLEFSTEISDIDTLPVAMVDVLRKAVFK